MSRDLPPASRSEFGSWFSGILRERGIKQRKLAEDLGISENAVSAWKMGVCMPRRRNLDALLEQLQVRSGSPPPSAATALGDFVAEVVALQPSVEELAAAVPDLLRVLQEAEQRAAAEGGRSG